MCIIYSEIKIPQNKQMAMYKVKNLLDITQPLLNHSYSSGIPSVFKAVVEVTESEEDIGKTVSMAAPTAKPAVSIIYIETEGKEIGKGTVFECAERHTKIICLSKTRIVKQTQYKIDRDLVTALLSKTKSSTG